MCLNMRNGETCTITIFYVIDTSDAMIGAGQDGVNETIRLVTEKLDDISNYFFEKIGCTISFRHVRKNLTFSNFSQTCGELLTIAGSAESPVILVFLASKPEDNYMSALNHLKNNENFKNAIRMAIPRGFEADIYLLNELVAGQDGSDNMVLCDGGYFLGKRVHMEFIRVLLLKMGIDADNDTKLMDIIERLPGVNQ